MKNIILSLILVLTLFLSTFLFLPSEAASGTLIMFQENTATVGDTIKVSVKVSNENIKGCSFNLLYDDSMLEFKGCNGTGSPAFSNGKATTKVDSGTVNACTINFTFYVKNSGSVNFQVRNVSALSTSSSSIEIEGASAKLTIKGNEIESPPEEVTNQPGITAKPENNEQTNQGSSDSVMLNGKQYKVAKSLDGINIPTDFKIISSYYNGVQVAALSSNDFSTLILCLLDESNTPLFVFYDDVNNTMEECNFITAPPIALMEFPIEKIPEGFEESEVTINNQKLIGYQNEYFKENNRYLVFGIKDSEKGIYVYDAEDSTYQKYLSKEVNIGSGNYFENKIIVNSEEGVFQMDFELFVVIACFTAGIICLLLAMVIGLRSKNKRLKQDFEDGACLMKEIDNDNRVIREYIYKN